MKWFNGFGLFFIVLILIPNIIFAVKNSGSYTNKYQNKRVEFLEQIGRYGCIVFMIFNIPRTYFGWWFPGGLVCYLLVNAFLLCFYYGIWIFYRKKNNSFKALSLSILPSVMFLFSGIACRSILLILSASVFAPTHIFISYKNAD